MRVRLLDTRLRLRLLHLPLCLQLRLDMVDLGLVKLMLMCLLLKHDALQLMELMLLRRAQRVYPLHREPLIAGGVEE